MTEGKEDKDDEAADKARTEAYLRARGWVPYFGDEDNWFRRGGAGKPVPMDEAARRQLKEDVVGFVYMLEELDDKRPRTRKLVGGLLAMLVLDVVKMFFDDKTAVLGLAADMTHKLIDLFKDGEFRKGIAALAKIWQAEGQKSDLWGPPVNKNGDEGKSN